MAVHKTSRSGLFLLELMIVILFFAVTSAVCVNLFVQAHLTSTAGGELTAATREVQSAAEWLKAADGDLEKLAAQLDAKAADGRLDLYFDVGWNRTGAQDAIYTVTVLCCCPAAERLLRPQPAGRIIFQRWLRFGMKKGKFYKYQWKNIWDKRD